MSTIAERLGLGDEIRELKLGRTFTSKDANNSFHTIRYDFKPASLDSSKAAILDIQDNNKVTVTAPNAESSGTSETVFKGSRRPHQKECVLIIDHETGEITLEKLSQNIIVKRTRQGMSEKSQTKSKVQSDVSAANKKPVPHQQKPNSPNSATNRQNSPNKHKLSPPKANGQLNSQQNTGQPISPSMPTLSALSNMQIPSSSSTNTAKNDSLGLSESSSDSSDHESDSSSDSSSSSSDSSGDEQPVNNNNAKLKSKTASSDSDSDDDMRFDIKPNVVHNTSNGSINPLPSMPKFSQLSEDLRLSESGSDSDD